MPAQAETSVYAPGWRFVCRSYRTLTSVSAFHAICSDNNQSSFFSHGEPSKISTVGVHRALGCLSDINGGNVVIGVVTCVYNSQCMQSFMSA